MATSRDAILGALPATAGSLEPPALFQSEERFADPLAAFVENLEAAGGRARLLTAAELEPELGALASSFGASRVFSALAPHAASPARPADLDLAVLRGGPAVAENGAVWWQPRDSTERAAGFLAQHVALVVPRASLVDTLHSAYAGLDPAGSKFGCFVSGPSKTADIAQALVIGAHGPRSLDVILVASES